MLKGALLTGFSSGVFRAGNLFFKMPGILLRSDVMEIEKNLLIVPRGFVSSFPSVSYCDGDDQNFSGDLNG